MNYLSVYNDIQNNSNIVKILFNLGGRSYKLSRVPTDSVAKTLKRIGLSVNKATSTKQKEKKTRNERPDDAKEIPVTLYRQNGEIVEDEVSNFEAWSEGNVLEIAGCKFLVEKNTPIVHSASLPSVTMASFPVVPTLKLEFSDRMNSHYKWFKQRVSLANELSDITAEQSTSEGEEEWAEVGQEFVYVPGIEDTGCQLKMSCKAASTEKEAHTWYDVVTSSGVSAGPGQTPFEERQIYTTRPISDASAFRIVSYNILASCYLEDEATCEAWFGYCPKYALAIEYRQQLLLKEIVGYNADIVCLQECGSRLFENYLGPVMKSNGFTGVAMYKSGVMSEGEAIFFKDSKFSLISQHNVVVSDCFQNEPCNQDFLENVKRAPKVLERLSSRTTVAQLVVLQHADRLQDYICLVNTHLYFRPNAPFIRNLQVITILNHLSEIVKKLDMDLKQTSADQSTIGVVFCADFNSLPYSGAVQLMSTGTLEGDHTEWVLPEDQVQSACNFKVPSYSHSFEFRNCCGFPEFTTYTDGFKGAIDYIFASRETFEVQAVIPMPSEDELRVYTAIPSPVMPSDHLALICELKWKKN